MNSSKLKVFWLCNCSLSDLDTGGSGAWLASMAQALLNTGEVDLASISSWLGSEFKPCDHKQVKQWLVPARVRFRDGLPPASLVDSIVTAVSDFAPDLIHVWGTEEYWGLLTARKLLDYPTLLEMQGMKGEIAKAYYGGLTWRERLSCIGPKEVLLRKTMEVDRHKFARWGKFDEEIVRNHRFIDVQSLWVTAHARALNPSASLFPVDLALREHFYAPAGWQPSGQLTLFCTAASHPPYKGLHVAIRALALLKQRLPGVRLRIAGDHQRRGIRQSGYMRWINRLVRQLGLSHAVEWLGPLNAEQIVAELKKAPAVVIPTFAENCCTAMQEVMAIGTPIVASQAGGVPSLGKDEESCLFFPPGDAAMCAFQLERVLTDADLALRLSVHSRKTAAVRNDRERIVRRQLEIYRQVVDASKTGSK